MKKKKKEKDASRGLAYFHIRIDFHLEGIQIEDGRVAPYECVYITLTAVNYFNNSFIMSASTWYLWAL